MRKRFVLLGILIIMLALVGCSLFYNEYDFVRYKAPNWTDDGKIVFVKDYRHVRDRKTITGLIGDVAGSWEAYILCEIDKDGNNYTEICTLAVCKESAYLLRIDNTSSSGDWVSIGMLGGYGMEKGVYVVKRDGSGLEKVGEGLYPDLSPDGSKIVYAKPNQGIWIMNRDGSGDHQIVEEGTQPAWSPDGSKLIYRTQELLIADNNGNIIDSIGNTRWGADWGPLNSDSIIVCDYSIDKGIIIDLSSGIEDTLSFYSGTGFKWSNDGKYIVGSDSVGYYSININGTNKHYIEP